MEIASYGKAIKQLTAVPGTRSPKPMLLSEMKQK